MGLLFVGVLGLVLRRFFEDGWMDVVHGLGIVVMIVGILTCMDGRWEVTWHGVTCIFHDVYFFFLDELEIYNLLLVWLTFGDMNDAL